MDLVTHSENDKSEFKVKKRSENYINNMRISNSILINAKYLECILGKTMSGETMAFCFISKINENLKFFLWKNRFVTPVLR